VDLARDVLRERSRRVVASPPRERAGRNRDDLVERKLVVSGAAPLRESAREVQREEVRPPEFERDEDLAGRSRVGSGGREARERRWIRQAPAARKLVDRARSELGADRASLAREEGKVPPARPADASRSHVLDQALAAREASRGEDEIERGRKKTRGARRGAPGGRTHGGGL